MPISREEFDKGDPIKSNTLQFLRDRPDKAFSDEEIGRVLYNWPQNIRNKNELAIVTKYLKELEKEEKIDRGQRGDIFYNSIRPEPKLEIVKVRKYR